MSVCLRVVCLVCMTCLYMEGDWNTLKTCMIVCVCDCMFVCMFVCLYVCMYVCMLCDCMFVHCVR